jgi:hypothetical protein
VPQHFLPLQQSPSAGGVAVAVPMAAVNAAIKRRYFMSPPFRFLLKKLDHAYMRGEPSLRRTPRVVAELVGAECALKHAEQSRRFVRPLR